MPAVRYQLGIVLLWLLTTVWFVKDEVLPFTDDSDVGYETILSSRQTDETTYWSIDLDGRYAGRARTRVRPGPDGTTTILAVLKLDDLETISQQPKRRRGSAHHVTGTEGLELRSTLRISPEGHLSAVDLEVLMSEASIFVALHGIASQGVLHFRVEGLEEIPAIPRSFDYAVPEDAIMLERLAPVDRIPGLYPGRSWTTRSVNPIAALPGPLKWLLGGEPVEVIHNRVTATEAITQDGQHVICHVVEHRQNHLVGKTWVRVTDGRVLRRVFQLAGMKMTLTRKSEVFH
ncbi:MAG: hypothetical protein ACC645_01020 [Pirellulales bacterium]